MKTMNIKNGIVTFLCAAALAGLSACDADLVERQGGKQPDKDGLTNTYGKLRSANSADNSVYMLMSEGGGFTTSGFYYELTKPATGNLSLEASVDPSLLDAYNEASVIQRTLLPAANYEFPDGKTLTVAPGENLSQHLRIRFLADNLAPGEYLLPVTVENAAAGADAEPQTLYYNIRIRQPQPGDKELDKDGVFLVGYINTEKYQPLLVTDYLMQKWDGTTWAEVWFRAIFNLINLRTVLLDYDVSSGRAMLNLGTDMRYVLDHTTEYIRPLQDSGREVCLCIEGGGKGLGFCNMTDGQISDFTAQVKTIIEEYGLDGVNLWDRNSGYGKEGMPAMNTTSYPKLIKALREALGADRLVTVVDHMEPTEYFWDTAATGGIEVGQYIDYAWSGYRSKEELIQIVDPWHPEGTGVSTSYTRQPIAGLDPSKYGCINVPWYSSSSPVEARAEPLHIFHWRDAGNKQSNILVYEDLRTSLQDEYESSWNIELSYGMFADDGMKGFWEIMPGYIITEYENNYIGDYTRLTRLPNGLRGYGKWLKDW